MILSILDAFDPSVAAFPAAFFIACGRPNQERSSPPLLTVLPLVANADPQEPEGVIERGDETSEGCTPQGSFFEFPPLDRGRDT